MRLSTLFIAHKEFWKLPPEHWAVLHFQITCQRTSAVLGKKKKKSVGTVVFARDFQCFPNRTCSLSHAVCRDWQSCVLYTAGDYGNYAAMSVMRICNCRKFVRSCRILLLIGASCRGSTVLRPVNWQGFLAITAVMGRNLFCVWLKSKYYI